jgi:hypothetical protein
MFTALALLLIAEAKPGPVLPAGASTTFQAACLAVQESLAKEDWAKAERQLAALPKRDLVVQWDDSKVPADLKELFAQARNDAFGLFGSVAEGPNFKLGAKGDVKIGFEPVLAKLPDASMPGGAAFFFNDNSLPRLETVIGLKRGQPLEKIGPFEVHNEVAHAIARYYGLAQNPLLGTISSRSDLPTSARMVAQQPELMVISQNLRVVDALREAVAKKRQLIPAKSDVFLDPVSADAGSVAEGKPADFSFQLTNRGSGPLTFRVVGDCRCVIPTPPGKIEAGGSAILRSRIDTTELVGDVHKKLVLFTNDPERPSLVIPLKVRVVPSFRFLTPGGPVAVLKDGENRKVVYLTLPEGSSLQPEGAQFDGFPGEVTMEPWAGFIADPEMGEASKKRSGYKMTIDFQEPFPTGRAEGTLVVRTTDPNRPRLRFPLYAQKGIVAMPEELYLGQLSKQGKKTSFLVSRPGGAAYTITSITSNVPNLQFSHQPVKRGEDYKVTVVYDGKSIVDINGQIVVKTTDPKQPEIRLPVRGSVQ